MPRGINYGEMRRILVESRQQESREKWLDGITDAIDAGHLKVDDFDLHQLFESTVRDGREIIDSWNPNSKGEPINFNRLVESGATDSSAFSTITKQIVYSMILPEYQSEEFVFTKIIPEVQSSFNGEMIPGIGGIGDKAEIVPELGTFPLVGPNEDWIRTPETKKRGLRTALTREAIFFNRVDARLRAATSAVGKSLGLNREKRATDCIIDENTTAHRYNRKDRGSIATYGNNSGSHDFDNYEASNALVDYTDVNNVMLLLSAMRDPNTGEPVMLGGGVPTLICTKALELTAKSILNATQIFLHNGGYATSGNLVEMQIPNPVRSGFNVVTSNLLGDRLATDTDWFFGYPATAFRYMRNWAMQVLQAPASSINEFNQDIVMEWRADERGAYATVEPRANCKSAA